MQSQSSSILPPVLITGVQGMIGRRVARLLEQRGRRVFGVDLRSGGWTPAKGGGFWLGDVRRIDLLAGGRFLDLVPEGGHVLHLASVVGVVEVLRRPVECHEVSVEGTRKLVALCQIRGAGLLFSSSSEVYGDGGGRKLSEWDSLPETYGAWPRAAYPEGKRAAEEMVLASDRGRVARLFNVSGPGQGWETGMVLPTFVRACLDGRPLPLIGDGQDLRCFQHVDDAAEALVRFLDAPEDVQRLLNVGGNERWAIADLAEEVQRILDRPVGVKQVSAEERYGGPAGGCHHREPDLRAMQQELGHRARRGLRQIVLDLAGDVSLQARSAV